jgi:integrase
MTKPSTAVSRKPRAEAQAYKEGSGYSIRCSYKGNAIYISGKKTAAAARKAAGERRVDIDAHGAPAGLGAERTTAAQAMQDYAMKRLPFKKGAQQEAVRMNHYLRAAGLDTLVVTKLERAVEHDNDTIGTTYFTVELAPHTSSRTIPQGLGAHRNAQMTMTADACKHRSVLACKAMASITRLDIQNYMDAMRKEKSAPATMKLEQALWRGLFNHAVTQWQWRCLIDNPATRLKMPKVDNERDRVMSQAEQELMDAALASCHNDLVAPMAALLRETAMRSSEPLQIACWKDVDWNAKLLRLVESKNDKRDVPLSPLAIQALETLREIGGGGPNDKIVKISYESFKAAWTRACQRAGLKNLKIHDLRHTAATRMALATGNLFLVKALTGHKTVAMVMRYANVKASDVVNVMHAPAQPAPAAAASSPAPTQESVAVAATPAPALYTMEQMQALAQLAATAALAGFKDANPVREPVAYGLPLTLVTPTRADHYEEDITRYRAAA